MTEVKNALKRMALYTLLLAVTVLPNTNIIPDSFLFCNLSSVWLLALSVCLFLYYYLRVAQRDRLRTAMLGMASMLILLMLCRMVKYGVFGSVYTAGRYVWYLYYVPLLCIPLFLFFSVSCISAKSDRQGKKLPAGAAAATLLLILLVLTNDLHQEVFRFQPGFAGWDSRYSYGWGFAVVTVWEYGLYAAAAILLMIKSRSMNAGKGAWLPAVPFAAGMLMILLLAVGKMPQLNGRHLLEFPETFFFMAAASLECCIQLGMIPTNESYRKLMQVTSIPLQITDHAGKVIYCSRTAQELKPQEFQAEDYARIGAHTLLRRMELPGGCGFQQVDVEEFDRLNDSLAEVKERLAEEVEIVRLQNELKEKQAKIEQRTRVYDTIAQNTQKQSLAISRLAKQARREKNSNIRDSCRRQIVLPAIYIKRYANLMLLASEHTEVSIGELGLAVAELTHYLKLCGIPAVSVQAAEGTVSSQGALAVFEAFWGALEEQPEELCGVYANLTSREGHPVLKLTVEYGQADHAAAIENKLQERLSFAGIQSETEQEDNIFYLSFVFPKGGAEA